MSTRKSLLKLEDVEYYAGSIKPGDPIVVTQHKDGAAEHPVGSYDPKRNKFKWDKVSVEDQQDELEVLVLKRYKD
jgi:hypothetical protein